MKNSMKVSVGLVVMMIAMTGFCFGQQKAKEKKAASNQEVVVEGHALPEKAIRVEGYPIRVEGVSLPEKSGNSPTVKEVVGYPLTDQEPVKDEISINRSRKLEFVNESKKSEVKITMTDEYNYLGISIRSQFSKGTVMVEIYNPKGEKQGTYTLKTEETVVLGDNTSSGEEVTGSFDKYFKLPLTGEWVIRAIPTAATGSIQLILNQKYIRRTDTF
jgi:hypothetical protein